jgi:Protein of unknown function (DUF3489)
MEIPMAKPSKTSRKKRLPKSKLERATAPRAPEAAVAKSFADKEAARPKQARVIAMLRSPSGATIATMMQETGWQQHSVRGFLAGVVRKKLKLKLQSSKVDGHRIYRIDGEAPPSPGGGRPKRRSA